MAHDESSGGSPHDTVLRPFVTFVTIVATVAILTFGERVHNAYKRVAGWISND